MILPGLSITALQPLWVGSLATDQLTEEVDAYQHEIRALGGYWSASFTIGNDRLAAEDWFTDGLGRHIEVYDDALIKIWEGFANKITVNNGPLTVVRGPLLDIANRVTLVYSEVDSTTTPPTVGLRTVMVAANDTVSQGRYGIRPVVLSTGGVDEGGAGEATQIRDLFITENADPTDSQQFSNQSAGRVSVTVECLGYVHWLDYPYEQTTNSGTVNASVKMLAVLAANPNIAWLALGTSYINTNTVQVSQWEDEDNLAWSIIKDIVARGDLTLARWLFGVYADLQARYYAAPTTLKYEQLLSDPKLRITEIGSGSEVYPWNVLPGEWLMWPDFLVGETEPTSLQEDPRAAFIESVTYTAPETVVIQGGKYETLPQLLGQLGLSGVGA